MAVLEEVRLEARITWLGTVANRERSLVAEACDELSAGFAGVDGEWHSGLTRASCSRVRDLYPVGTEIRNTRQVTILSEEELGQIAGEMGLERLEPALLGATMVVAGIPDFTHVPPSSRLQAESGATLVVDLENRPCLFPAKEIERAFPGTGRRFKQAAQGRRGVTAWIEREGTFRVGDAVRVFVPAQRAWRAPSET